MVPAATAAFAAQISPCGQSTPERPVGAIMTGMASFWPITVTDMSTSPTPRRTLGTRLQLSKDEVLRR